MPLYLCFKNVECLLEDINSLNIRINYTGPIIKIGNEYNLVYKQIYIVIYSGLKEALESRREQTPTEISRKQKRTDNRKE